MLCLERRCVVGAVITLGVLCFLVPGRPTPARGDEGSDWSKPFTPDEHTVVLYHFAEGKGNETHDACGDGKLTLRAKEALWGSRPGFGTTARFARIDDDANVLAGPINNPKLMLKPCTREWTVEAWVRYTGPWGGFGHVGKTYAHIAGQSEDGYYLSHTGGRGGFQIVLRGGRTPEAGHGLLPTARYEGNIAGKDPQHDVFFPPSIVPGFTGKEPAGIRDDQWHHVAWQFRYRDQTHFFFVDGNLVRRIQPFRKIVNDTDENVGVPFMVGGFVCWNDPPWPGRGNFVGEIDELRISDIMRYPVADQLSIIGGPGFTLCDAYPSEYLRAGHRFGKEALPFAALNIPYRVELAVDAPDGAVKWELNDGRLAKGLELREDGVLHGTVRNYVHRIIHFTVRAVDEGGHTDSHAFIIGIEEGKIATEVLPPLFVGKHYQYELETKYMVDPVKWKVASGKLPAGIVLDETSGELTGVPVDRGTGEFWVTATDANNRSATQDLAIRVLPAELERIHADKNTVFLYDWQDKEDVLYAKDALGDEALTLTCTSLCPDRRVAWPGREGRFPQDTGHGEHGWVSLKAKNDKHNLRTCKKEWTVEAWIRPGGPVQAFGDTKPFDFGHICGTYDTTESGVWELYISDHDSPDGSWAPGVHFQSADHTWKDLHPWKRSEGIVGNKEDAGIRDNQWHHVAWQYSSEEDLHQLFLDGRLIWRMHNPDGIKLVNNRQHKAQFSVSTRIDRYAYWCTDEEGRHRHPNYRGWGNFFGQIGEIRISDARRY